VCPASMEHLQVLSVTRLTASMILRYEVLMTQVRSPAFKLAPHMDSRRMDSST